MIDGLQSFVLPMGAMLVRSIRWSKLPTSPVILYSDEDESHNTEISEKDIGG